MRASLLATIALFLPLVVGCGTDAASGPAGAEIAPASAEVFLSVATDFDSEEWQQAVDVLQRFPDSDRAVQFLLEDAGLANFDVSSDLEPALGPETDVVLFDLAGEGEAVGLTQPDDPAKLDEVLAELDQDFVTREVDGWTAFSDSEAVLDRFESERADGTLSESADFSEAMGNVDGDALAKVYVNSASVEAPFPVGRAPTFALSLAAEEAGVRLEGVADSGEEGEGILPDPFAAELPETIPAGVLTYVGTSDLEGSLSALRDLLGEEMPQFDRDLARIEAEIGVSLEEDVFPLFQGETALYVRPGLFIPEVTLLTEVDDEAAAMATLDKLVTTVGEYLPAAQDVAEVEIAGLTAKRVTLAAPLALFYAAFEGRLVVTTSPDGISSLRQEDDRLADDEDFQAALEEADVPDETSGFAYVDLEEAISYVLSFIEQGSGETPPPMVRANLEPLQRLVLYTEKDGSTLHFAGLLRVD